MQKNSPRKIEPTCRMPLFRVSLPLFPHLLPSVFKPFGVGRWYIFQSSECKCAQGNDFV
ncbi:hypothetical protein Mapa_000682 [Marchantia paleacea]|nr:hypothetical protein Mapa_000682 [Marchantia paleacea]